MFSFLLFAEDGKINKKEYAEYTVLDFYYTDFHEGDKICLKNLSFYDSGYPRIYCKDSSTDDYVIIIVDEEKYYDMRENSEKMFTVYGTMKRDRKYNRKAVELQFYEYGK